MRSKVEPFSVTQWASRMGQFWICGYQIRATAQCLAHTCATLSYTYMYVLDRGFQVGCPRLLCMHTQGSSQQLPWEESAVSATCVKAPDTCVYYWISFRVQTTSPYKHTCRSVRWFFSTRWHLREDHLSTFSWCLLHLDIYWSCFSLRSFHKEWHIYY